MKWQNSIAAGVEKMAMTGDHGIEPCSNCHGTGDVTCLNCHGTCKLNYYDMGVREDYHLVYHGHGAYDCETCGGSGKTDCFVCSGRGTVPAWRGPSHS